MSSAPPAKRRRSLGGVTEPTCLSEFEASLPWQREQLGDAVVADKNNNRLMKGEYKTLLRLIGIVIRWVNGSYSRCFVQIAEMSAEHEIFVAVLDSFILDVKRM